MEVGSLSVPITADLGPLQRDLDRLRNQLGKTEKHTAGVTREMERMNRVSQTLTRQFQALGAALAAFLGGRAVINTLADFEASMSKVAAVTRASETDLAAMRESVKELGATTEFTASQVAEGFAFLGLAGFNASQSISAMPAVLDLATAASMDLGKAADISSNIMSAFGIAAEDASSATDILAAANARANTDIGQLGDAMKYVGPVAKALGVSIGDTAAAIGTLSDAGIQGGMAGTGLRRVLSSLTGATPAATKTLASMGLTIDQLNPKTNSLTDIIRRLAEAGLTAEEAFKIFGDRGAPAVLALIENAPKLNKLTEELKDVSGAAAEMASIMRDNLRGDLRGLSSAIESVVIALGESGLTDALRKVVQAMTAVTRLVASQIDRLVAYAGAIAGAVAGWGAYITVIAAVTHGTALLSAALVLLRANLIRIGIGAIVVAAGELIYQFTKLVERTGGVSEAFSLLGDVAAGTWEGIIRSAQAIPPALAAIWEDVKADFIESINQMKQVWNEFLETFEAPALTINGRTIIGGLDMSSFKADIDEAGEAITGFRDRAAELRTEAGALAREGLDQITKSLRLLRTPRESQGGRVRHKSPTSSGASTDDDNVVRDIIDSAGGANRELERLAKAYDNIVFRSQEFIAAQEIERQAIGLTDLEAAKLRARFDLLNQARRAGIDLTPSEIAAFEALADAMAEAEYQVDKLREEYEFNKDVFKGFFGDLKSELQNGSSMWEAFGTAAANALQKIADKALDMALNGIFDMIFGAFGGSSGGGFFSSLLGFEKGTSFAPGGYAVVGERGPELVKFSGGEQVIPNHRLPAQASFGGGGGSSTQRVMIDLALSDDLRATVQQEASDVVEIAISEYDSRTLPSSIERIHSKPRMR